MRIKENNFVTNSTNLNHNLSYELAVEESPHTELYKVKEIVNHPDYYLVGHRNDISVLVVEKRIQFNSFVGPACMPTGSENIIGSKVKVLGKYEHRM